MLINPIQSERFLILDQIQGAAFSIGVKVVSIEGEYAETDRGWLRSDDPGTYEARSLRRTRTSTCSAARSQKLASDNHLLRYRRSGMTEVGG